MKSIRSTLLLSVVVISIIAFWLAPGINTAKDTEYVRRYEDTDRRLSVAAIIDTTGSKQTRKKQRTADSKLVREQKVYKEERIRSTDKLSKLTLAKFSRAGHFEEIVSLPQDSLQAADTTKFIP